MRKLIFRFTVALLCFGLGLGAIRLTAPLRSLHTRQSWVQDEAAAPLLGPGLPAKAQAALIAETVESLRRIETEHFDNRIAPAAKPLLTRLKHQLIELFHSENTPNPERTSIPARTVQTNILERLKGAGVPVRKWEDIAYSDGYFQKPYAYGDIYGITVEDVAGHPELRVLTTTLGINCGEDTSFYLFKYEDSEWRLVLAQESNDYDEVSGGQGQFQYAISPPDAQGDFFVVTASINPWCSSNWQSIRYKVFRLGADPFRPRTILSDEDSIYLRDNDLPYKLQVRRDGFRLEFEGEGSPEEVTHTHVLRYTVAGDRTTKIGR
ncbi:MAG TPA: hypothetical protein VF544_07300 [Pyrinomonadaceae bacterium]|jgi:hypothetical protein